MSKCYLDIGTNSMGGYEKLTKELGIDGTFRKIFVEPNPECHAYIESQIGNDPMSTLLKVGVYKEAGEFELLTRDDMAGDSAATLMGIKFLGDSIGSVNQKVPSYNNYLVKTVTFKDILDTITEDEIYVKIDCEGCEYFILESYPFEYKDKIKKLYVEFHAHDEKMRERRDDIINWFRAMNIEILNWD